MDLPNNVLSLSCDDHAYRILIDEQFVPSGGLMPRPSAPTAAHVPGWPGHVLHARHAADADAPPPLGTPHPGSPGLRRSVHGSRHAGTSRRRCGTPSCPFSCRWGICMPAAVIASCSPRSIVKPGEILLLNEPTCNPAGHAPPGPGAWCAPAQGWCSGRCPAPGPRPCPRRPPPPRHQVHAQRPQCSGTYLLD
jgi:hypothetical protein